MTSSQKTAVSLLVSVILFAAFSVVAFTGLFSVIDARFYEPEKISQIQKHLDTVSENYDEYITTLESRFGKNENSFLKQKSVLSYIESRASEEDVLARSRLSGELFSQTPGLLGMRLIDKNGVNIHFSTFGSDILNRTSETVSYKNYTDSVSLSGQKEISFEKIYSPDSFETSGIVCKTVFDGNDNRIIFSFPFYDVYSAYRGSFIFYVNANDFNRVLLSKKLITFGNTGILVSGLNSDDDDKSTDYKSGFVFGIPAVANGKQIFENEILSRWQKGLTSPEKIVYKKAGDSFSESEFDAAVNADDAENKKNNYWILVSSTKTAFGYVGGIYPDEIFVMSDGVKILLLVCIFVTLFLVVFLIVNLKQDDMVVIRERIRRLQLGIVTEFLKQKEAVDWKIVSGKIAERRQDVSSEIMKSLGRSGKKHSAEINDLINRSWDELLTAMNVESKKNSGTLENSNIDEIKKLLEELLSSGSIKVQSVQPQGAVQQIKSDVQPAVVQALDDVEELGDTTGEDVEEIEDIEEVEEAESADVEEIEEIENVEEVESAEPEVVEQAGEVEELEEISGDEVEELEEIEDAENAESDGVEELEEISELESDGETKTESPATSEDVTSEFETQAVDVSDLFSDNDIPQHEEHNPESELEDSDDVENINIATSVHKPQYDEEDDQIIENFSVENPDFSGLDLLSAEENLNGQASIQNGEIPPALSSASADEDGGKESASGDSEFVSLDEFDVEFKQDEQQLGFDEVIGFGSAENTASNGQKAESLEPVDFNIEPESPKFLNLDQTVEVKKGRKSDKKKIISETDYSIENIKNQVQAQAMTATDDIGELSEADMQIPFSFTQFASVLQSPEELKPFVDVIHEDSSGVYVIETDGQEQEPEDLNFKELVDSVLKK
ncbi:MAG: hypothetical protein ACI4LX_08600 [Treponema sp.]